MSRLVRLLIVTFLCSLHSPSVAQSTNQSNLMMFSTISTTVHSTLRASTNSSDNASTTSDQTEAVGTGSSFLSNATVPLNSSSTTQNETSPSDRVPTTPSVGETEASEMGTESTMQPVSPTTELRGPNETRSSAVPSWKPGVVTPTLTETPPGTARATDRASTVPDPTNPETEKNRPSGKTLGVFIGLAVVLLLVLGLVYLIYNRTQKDDPFSHQRLYNSDPVLSLDVSVEPADRFYGSLTPELGREGQGDHVMSQRALNQTLGEVKDLASEPRAREEIQLKPMSESSVKIFL